MFPSAAPLRLALHPLAGSDKSGNHNIRNELSISEDKSLQTASQQQQPQPTTKGGG